MFEFYVLVEGTLGRVFFLTLLHGARPFLLKLIVLPSHSFWLIYQGRTPYILLSNCLQLLKCILSHRMMVYVQGENPLTKSIFFLNHVPYLSNQLTCRFGQFLVLLEIFVILLH